MTAAKENKSPMDKIYLHTYIDGEPPISLIFGRKKKKKIQHYTRGFIFLCLASPPRSPAHALSVIPFPKK